MHFVHDDIGAFLHGLGGLAKAGLKDSESGLLLNLRVSQPRQVLGRKTRQVRRSVPVKTAVVLFFLIIMPYRDGYGLQRLLGTLVDGLVLLLHRRVVLQLQLILQYLQFRAQQP